MEHQKQNSASYVQPQYLSPDMEKNSTILPFRFRRACGIDYFIEYFLVEKYTFLPSFPRLTIEVQCSNTGFKILLIVFRTHHRILYLCDESFTV